VIFAVFSDDVLNIILKYINQKIGHNNFCTINCYYNMLDIIKLKVFIGYTMLARQKKKNFSM